ncbi:hypothetical protein ECG_05191 [Echinococcus granulosus]|nr:hypothetical protein ECG_05191 [Echinococcus granulosus]
MDMLFQSNVQKGDEQAASTSRISVTHTYSIKNHNIRSEVTINAAATKAAAATSTLVYLHAIPPKFVFSPFTTFIPPQQMDHSRSSPATLQPIKVHFNPRIHHHNWFAFSLLARPHLLHYHSSLKFIYSTYY